MLPTKLTLKHLIALISFFVLLFSSIVSSADEFRDESETAQLPVMPVVEVAASRLDPATGKSTLDKDLIDRLPSRNNSISELLLTIPGVQTSEGSNSSKSGGEIAPNEISISGARTYESRFVLDGLNINNIIDPGNTVDTISDIPAPTLEYFIPDHLIKDITVYHSNIPARYGGFTGGVVIANTVEPEPELTGEVTYKTTRSDWGQFYINPDDDEEFSNSVDSSNQPNFVKHNTTGIVNFPISDKSSGLFSYSRLESSIPLKLINSKQVERRRSEDFFSKYFVDPSTSTKFTLTASYAPYKSDNYIKDTLNSNYSIESGGYMLRGKLNKALSFSDMQFDLGLDESTNNREAPSVWKSWRVSPSKNWGDLIDSTRSKEGGNGSIEKIQSSITGKVNFDFKEISTGSVEHILNTGAVIEHTSTQYERLETTTRYSGSTLDPTVDCNGETVACVDGEQFFYFKSIYPKDEVKARITNYSFYVDDQIIFSKLNIRPGLRVSYNDFQKNLDYAPRFSVSFDVFGNRKTTLIGGANRYYGEDLLTYMLAEKKKQNTTWERSKTLDINNNILPWQNKPRTIFVGQRYSDLETPYSDELTIGLKQKLFGGTLDLLYIDRNYKNQYMTVVLEKDINGYIYREFTNNGRRYHEQFRASWERNWSKHYFSINLTWQETKSNSLEYSDIYDPDLDELLVWYDGKAVYKDKLATSDYNRPYIVNAIYAVDLPNGFSFTNKTRYESRYRAVEKTSDPPVLDPVSGEVLDVYDDVNNPSALIFDWKILWESPEWKENQIEVFLDILNVFNRKVAIGNDSDEYKLGRQFWAGLTYKF